MPCHGEHCGAADRVDKADTVTMIMTEYREAEGRNIPQVNYRNSHQLGIMVTGALQAAAGDTTCRLQCGRAELWLRTEGVV